MTCWQGYERVPGTAPYTKGSCRKKSSRRSARRVRRSRKRSPRRARRSRRKSPRRYSYQYKSKRSKKRVRRSRKRCSPGKNKKFAKMVQGKCIRFGDPNMTIKKHKPGRKRSFCARHRCSQKRNKATPGYQSCKKWNCKTG